MNIDFKGVIGMNKEFWSRRLRNKAFWVSFCSSALLLLQLLEVELEFIPENAEGLANVILTMLTLLGVLNDPTNTSGIFTDTVDMDEDGIPDIYDEDFIEQDLEDENAPKG